MKGKAFALAGAAGAFVISGMASAAYVGMGGPDDINMGLTAELVDPAAEGWDLLGYDAGALDTYRIYANFDANGGAITAIGAADLVFELGSRDGAFFNAALGGNFAPDADFAAVIADLNWDTFMTIGEAVGSAMDGSAVTGGSPGFDDLEGGGQAFGLVGNFTMLNAGWFVSGFPAIGDAVDGRVLVAQLTVADGIGVFGTNWRVSGVDENGESFDIVSNFDSQFIPAPGAIALLGLAGLVSGRRRRR